MQIDRHEPSACAVCARSAVGYGYAPTATDKPLWVCDDPECLTIARDSYTMKQDDFTRIESLAAGKGGEKAGAFLEEIGKFSLADLTPDEWFEFCRRLVGGYRTALKTDLRDEAPF